MAKSVPWYLSAIVMGAVAVFLAGCDGKQDKAGTAETGGGQAEKNPHDHEKLETFAAGVGMLKEHYSEIKAAFGAGNSDDAHAPLHCMGEILEALPELAKSADLTEDQMTSLQGAVDNMFEAYGKIDEAMHAQEDPDYTSVSSALDENMAVLEELVAE